MHPFFGLHKKSLSKYLPRNNAPLKRGFAAATLVGASVLASVGVASALPAHALAAPTRLAADPAVGAPAGAEAVLLQGATTASYFWDDSSGRAGDTGLPASGRPMQKGMIASPSWPLLTEGYILYKGKKARFFVGDRGPGNPSNQGIMVDIDAKTFADLTGGTFNAGTLGVDGNGGMGHIDIQYVVTKWGDGTGIKNHPVAFSTGAWGRKDTSPARPPATVFAMARQLGIGLKTQLVSAEARPWIGKPKVMVEPVSAHVPTGTAAGPGVGKN
ncbi:hypothetical protein [Streptosporangium sp. NBC_01469]|uniref:hypothetical protein n=1 Tax=Streptosporangium sp. NBC_01469 TaxID=2903898 RepID=UPI002E2A4938|nr:hypothetical protein [Streptosporangium sp. NBC_01469]